MALRPPVVAVINDNDAAPQLPTPGATARIASRRCGVYIIALVYSGDGPSNRCDFRYDNGCFVTLISLISDIEHGIDLG